MTPVTLTIFAHVCFRRPWSLSCLTNKVRFYLQTERNPQNSECWGPASVGWRRGWPLKTSPSPQVTTSNVAVLRQRVCANWGALGQHPLVVGACLTVEILSSHVLSC